MDKKTYTKEQELSMREIVRLAQQLKKEGYIRSFKPDTDSLILSTGTPFHRTTEETNHLDEIAKELGTEITSSGNEEEKEYHLKRGLSILSQKTAGKGFGSYKALRIKVEPVLYDKSTEGLLIKLLERL